MSREERDLPRAIEARRGYAFLDFPMTAREARYFRHRDRLQEERHTGRLADYVRRRPAVFGALSIEDDYPRRPYVQVRVTRDLERHPAAIRRRFSLRFGIKRVLYTERDLNQTERSASAPSPRCPTGRSPPTPTATLTVTLSAPLGDRGVRSTVTGRRLRRETR